MKVEISHPDRVVFPDDGITKGDIIDYYRRVAPVMVRHLRGRPLMLERYPEGIAGPRIVQKDAQHFPDWVHRVEVPKAGGSLIHAVCDDEDTLVYLANQGCLTFHTWLSRVDRLECPDQLIFDLDPPPGGFSAARTAARALRDVLSRLGLVPFLKTSGSRGLHVVAPLDGRASFDEVRSFARAVSDVVVATDPRHLTTEVRKEKRDGRVFVDVLRNAYAQTAVAPYSVRARPEAPVATPLDWSELAGPRAEPGRYTTRNLFRRLGRKPDPWASMARERGSVSAAGQALESLSRRAS